MSTVVDARPAEPKAPPKGRRRAIRGLRRPALPRWTPADPTPAANAVLWALLTLAGLAAWLIVFGVGLSSLTEQHHQATLYAKFRYELNQAIAPLGGNIPEGVPVAMLQSTKGGLHNVVVIEGSTSGDLRNGPGHYPGTPLPGQAGVSEILGRGTTFGAPFGSLSALRNGDTITATTGQGVFRYTVEDVRVAGSPEPPALAAGAGRLTLITTEGTGWLGVLAPSRTIYVDALLYGTAQPAPHGVSLPRAADGISRGDSVGLYPLVLWVQLLVVAVLGLTWARLRWGGPQSWIVGVPVVLAALWGASNALWVLLPNLL